MSDPCKASRHNASTLARRRAAVCFGFSIVFAVAGVLLFFLRFIYRLLEGVSPFLIFGGYLLGFVFLNVAFWAMRRGRRYLASRGEEVLAKDPRSPVLYLRPFKLEMAARAIDRFPIGIMQAFPDTRLEEGIVLSLQSLGPVIAIGRPGETLPELGAARLQVQEDEWQSEVVRLLCKSQLAVITAGTSWGLQWEIGKAVELLKPTQILFFFADFDERDSDRRALSYQAFREAVAPLIPAELPADIGGAVFLLFSETWKPILISPPAGTRWIEVLGVSMTKAKEIISPGFKAKHMAAQEEFSKLSGISRLRYAWLVTPYRMRVIIVGIHAAMILLFAVIIWFVTLKIFPENLWPLTSAAVLGFTVLDVGLWMWALYKTARPYVKEVDDKTD